ncbi:hypothetical protein D9M69_467900 [compost metagenome]
MSHRGHADHGEGFVDFHQIHVIERPAGFLHQLLDCTNRCHREQARGVGERSVAMNHRQGFQALFLCLGLAHQHQRGGTVGDRTGVRCRHRTAFAERRLQRSNLVQPGLWRLLVVADHHLLFADRHSQRHDFGLEAAVLDRLLRASGRGNGKRVLGFTAEAVGFGAVFGEGAHQAALVVGVFEAVQEHRVLHSTMAHAVSGTGAIQQVGRVGHAFHATGHHHIGTARQQHVVGQNRRFHAGAAHLVQGGAAGRFIQPRA